MNSQVYKHIRRRFGKWVKFTSTYGQYWDVHLLRFVSIRSYFYYIWYSSYYVGHSSQIIVASYLYQLSLSDGAIPEMNYDHKNLTINQNKHKIVIGIGVLIWHIIVASIPIASLRLEFQDEITETLNQAFVLDSSLKRIFSSTKFRSSNKLEKILPWICWLPLPIPLIFNLAFFHPSNPIRAMIENALEIEITILSPYCWLFLLAQTWGAACIVGVVLGVILPFLIVLIVCQNWLLDDSLELSRVKTESAHNGPFETKHLGNVSEDKLILIYRSLQLLAGLSNLVCATLRVAYHSAAMMMIVVFSSFTLIKQGRSLLSGGSIMAFSLALILIGSVVLGLLIFYIECQVIDELEARSRRYKNNIIASKSRRSRVYKTAISFRAVTVMTTYPFCNVNRSTFLEYINACINNLVTLLLI